MTFEVVLGAMALPAATRVDRRVPKALLLEQAAASSTDKRNVRDGLDELVWVAAMKPDNIGVPPARDEHREYLEVAVLTGTVRGGGNATALARMIHRAIPYPVILWLMQDDAVTLSVAHKRRSQAHGIGFVAEEVREAEAFRPAALSAHQAAFLQSLALAALPQANLFALYDGVLDRVLGLDAAALVGTFRLSETTERAVARRLALARCHELQTEILSLRGQAERETQIANRVDMNLTIKRIEADLAAAKNGL